jgi:phage FluMu protein Com
MFSVAGAAASAGMARVATAASNGSAILQQQQYQQQQSQQWQQAQQAQLQSQQAQSQPQQQSQQLQQAQPGQRKYVCCGACRQWLIAPAEYVLVVCPSCQAVNNCNLIATTSNTTTNTNTSIANQEMDTRALQRPRQPKSVFTEVFDCLTRPFIQDSDYEPVHNGNY